VQLTDLKGARLIVPPEGKPHRTMLSRMLATAEVPWTIAAEASGWELMLHFAALGLGLAVVNDFCRIPKGLIARPVRGLPGVRYSLLARADARPGARVSRLQELILERVRGRH
jgi:DNA-binding transcriptional LysR family regulator